MTKKKRLVLSWLLVLALLLAGCNPVVVTTGSAPGTAANTTGSAPGTTGTEPSTTSTEPGATTTEPTAGTTAPDATGTVPNPPVESTVQTTPTTQPAKSYTLQISLLGEQEITLEYGTNYVDAGAAAFLFGDDLPDSGQPITDIIIDNPVDTGKTGTYTIMYLAEYDAGGELLCVSAQRTVHVVDTQAPVITLVSNPDGFTYPGHAYVEEGYAAIDGYDGDITSRVERTEENGIVTYRVSDAAGNETVVTRTIRYDDPVAPELTLKGENPMTIKAGEGYVEPGCVAVDGCDGDLTDQVLIAGTVSKYLAGTYVISYSVQDAAGNIAIAERTVIVEPVSNDGEVIRPNGKVIYLTFDDGPSQHTPRLLDVLDKYNVKATFFVVNTYYVGYVKDIVERGHAIGVHSTTHEYSEIYASEDAYFADLTNMRDIIYKRTGVHTNLIRFPGGSSNTVSKFNPGIMTRLTQAVEDMGYHYFDWNVESGDAGRVTTAEAVADNVISGCKGRQTSIVLQHDSKGYSVDAVEQIIIWGLQNGYTFLPLDETSPTSHHAVFN